MKSFWMVIPLFLLAINASWVRAQIVEKDIPYVTKADKLQTLDVYTPAKDRKLPVVYWIHGGGWQTGDKGEVASKPKAFNDRGMVFVSVNYRLLPQAEMKTIVEDVAAGMRWVKDNVSQFGGDPNQVFVMGHSAGAQLAALLCTDHRYLNAVGLDIQSILGCVPSDGDTYDIPAMILLAETRRHLHGQPQAKFGHREKFGNDPSKHIDFSPITHIARDKGIPPFLVVYVANHPDTSAQAEWLGKNLKTHGVPVQLYGAKETDHSKINQRLGEPGDPTTDAMFAFCSERIKGKSQ